MTAYRVNFTRIGQDTGVAPLVTEAGDRIDLALNIGEYVNSSRTAQRNREIIGEAGEDYGTFTVTAL